MEELLTKLKTKFPNLTLSSVNLGRSDKIPIHIYKNLIKTINIKSKT